MLNSTHVVIHFQMTDLKNIFQLCVGSLNEICKMDGSFSENALMLIKSLLLIAESTLMWAFISATNILFILHARIYRFVKFKKKMFFP